MKDVRPRAESMAQQKRSANAPPGTGFVSEREKAKQALVRELDTYSGQGVQKIAAQETKPGESGILTAAAYCRVSTDDIDQVISIELQKKHYKEMISANPRWKYCGTYVDNGLSGTNIDHRPAFKLMMKDALAGKIQIIITKSVSRFARNLVDCITWVRKLQAHDPPIAVYFEQENLNTLDSTSNIILFVLAMVAEEESHMKSEAMQLSLEWRLSRGRFITPKRLGYDRVEVTDVLGNRKKKLVINDEQAKTVRLMYYMLLNGSSTAEIAETLTELKRETGHIFKDGTVNTNWTAGGVACILRNERYCGDVLARKTFTPNYTDHKSKKNRTEKNKYYQAAYNDAIVTRGQWNAAQLILNSHRYSHSGGYLPIRVITDGALTGYISVNRSWAGITADEYYRVCSIAMGLSEGTMETDLDNIYMPDGQNTMMGPTDEGNIQRIARELTVEEQEIKAEMEGEVAQENTPEMPTVKPGFQVVSGNMFSHVFDPVIRISKKGIAFNSTCISRMNRITQAPDGLDVQRQEYVELLFNPVERMLVVRPCEKDHVNAIHWSNKDGRSVNISASAFSKILYEILDWDTDYSYRIPAAVRTRNGETVIFFDLDNFIGRATQKKVKKEEETETEEAEQKAPVSIEGIFYGAEDDEEPQPIEDLEALEEKLRQIAEVEKLTFGTPVFEHGGAVYLTEKDNGEVWDVMTEAKILDESHSVEQSVVDALQEELLEQAVQNEEVKSE